MRKKLFVVKVSIPFPVYTGPANLLLGMVEGFPKNFLERIKSGPPGMVTAIASREPNSALCHLEELVDQEYHGTRLVGLRVDRFTTHQKLLGGCIRGLAEAALAIWPDWYGAELLEGKPMNEPDGVSQSWREKALKLASLNQVPLPEGYPKAIHAYQLALTIGDPDLIISLASGELLHFSSCKSLVAVSTWLSEQSKARVALFVSESIFSSPEFERVNKVGLVQFGIEPVVKATTASGSLLVTVTSIKGRPNPTSPGEIKLSQKLSSDNELAGLFSFNQPIKSVHNKEYRVDLLWPAGKLVVEVDGYTYHCTPFDFGQDRHRDYELLISGYRVLRLTHEEVIKDIEKSVAKIRDSVRFLQKNFPHGCSSVP